jgi:CRISPR/Cas system-associated exonuclease Cas4 (RecB family)
MNEQKVIKSNILLPILADSYRAEYTEWERRNLRFSDAGCAAKHGEKCERAIYYDIYQADQKSLLTTGSLALFDDGRIHEQDIRRRLRTILRSPEREVTDPETGARGKIDNTIYYGSIKPDIEELQYQLGKGGSVVEFIPGVEASKDPGLEIKSVNEFQFQEMARSGVILQHYYDQIQSYLWITQLPFFICLIKNRNSNGPEKGVLPFLEFIVLPDTDRQKEIRTGFRVVKEALDQNILPPRPFLRESSQCQFCRYKHVCWPKEEEQKPPIPDATVSAPDKEMLESAIRTYSATGKQISELKKQQDEAKEVIVRYFQATGKTELLVDHFNATYSQRTSKSWDIQYLRENLTYIQQLLISDPSEEKLKQAIADRKIDAIVLEEAIKTTPSGNTLRVTEIKIKESNRQELPKKEEVSDDKGIKRDKKVPTPRKSKAGNKKDSTKRKRVSGGSRVLRAGSEHREPEQGPTAPSPV